MVVGIAAGILFLGLAYGINNKRMEASINSYLSHVQIHHKEFRHLDLQGAKKPDRLFL